MDIRKRTTNKQFSIASVFIVLMLACCTSLLVRSTPASKLEQILTLGELHVLSHNGPITFYEGSDGLTGFEFTLLQGFAQSLGVKLIITDEKQTPSIFNPNSNTARLESYDIANASAISTQNTVGHVRFSAPYMTITQQLIFNTDHAAPIDTNDLLNKKIVALANSAQSEILKALQKSLPELRWQEVSASEVMDLLDMVEQGQADYAVVDSAMFTLYRYSYPHTQLAFNLNTPQPIAWALPQTRDNSLYNALQMYIKNIRVNGTLAQVNARFFNQMEAITSDDAMMFSYQLSNRLPLWQDSLKNAAHEFGLDWHLLAAISYQESHWNPQAESYTGVRGFMMLTNDTAKELGVNDREDPTQSIQGGAKYIQTLYKRLPEKIMGDDRLYMTLAAYNMGLGHLEDARVLTEKMGGNPNHWADVSKYFPLLAKEQYFDAAKHGYARGWEPVTFVQNVINYQKMSAQYEKHEQFRLATTNGNTTISPQAEPSAIEKLSKNNLGDFTSFSIL